MGVSYENGNIHSPVIVIGDDPTEEGNVLVARLGTPVSVPKNSVTETEGTPTEEEGEADTGTETDENAEG